MRYTVLVLLALACVVHAQDDKPQPEPKSPAAREAITKAKRAVLVSQQQLVKDLGEAKKLAMKGENLDEANAIDAVIKSTQEGIDVILKPAKAKPATKATQTIDGLYRMSLNGGASQIDVKIAGGKILDWPSQQNVPYDRQGNEIRVTWPMTGISERYIFTGDSVYSESWKRGRPAFVGAPDGMGVGVRIPPK